MNYIYRIENLDCANCTAAIEAAISKMAGVKSCSINFFSEKLNIQTENEMTDDLFKKIQKAAKKSGAKIIAI